MGRAADPAWRRLRRGQVRAEPCVGTPPGELGDFPDPYVLPAGDVYYAYGTQAGGMHVPVLRSDDLTHWELVGDALPTVHSWAARGRTWSPAVHRIGDGYVLYHAVWEPRSDRQCIAVATAPVPEGPFVDALGRPLVLQLDRGGSIDPSVFVDADDRTYLLWKSDDNALRRRPSLWGQRLSDDGLGLLGSPVELLRHDRVWEEPLIEAPALILADGTYYLFYSANWWESDRYSIGYAVASSALGPYSKVTRDGPWMVSGPEAAGPGGQEFFVDAAGQLRMAYHAWAPGAVGYRRGGRRCLCLSRIGFVDGRPVVQP